MSDRISEDESQVECVRMHRAIMKLAQGLGNPALHWDSRKSNIYEAVIDYALQEIARLKELAGEKI